MRIVPVAAIFGGNASGKTNFVEALAFAKRFVTEAAKPNAPIPVEPFRLDSKCGKLPTFMAFNLMIDEVHYEFSFSVTAFEVVEEMLMELSASSHRVLYRREKSKITFGCLKSSQQKNLHHLIFEATNRNQLFISALNFLKVDGFPPVYEWFSQHLQVIGPSSHLSLAERKSDESESMSEWVNEKIRLFDTGIVRLAEESINLEQVPVGEFDLMSIEARIGEGETVRIALNHNQYILCRINGRLSAKKLISYHRNSEGGEEKFDVTLESGGTHRVIDLLHIFKDLASNDVTQLVIIDEFDRSLHPKLAGDLLEEYLDSCHLGSKSQLVFTTHNVMLLDQGLFRRDEIWITERDRSENSALYCLSKFKTIRFDKDIRKAYINGRLGGVPNLKFRGTLR